jgi:replication factor C subunit 2/4
MHKHPIQQADGRSDHQTATRDLQSRKRSLLLFISTFPSPLSLGWHVGYQQIKYSEDGIAALIFTSEGDMRQAINNLQSTFSGFDFVSADAVFKVCDQPHPVTVEAIIRSCHTGDIDAAMAKLQDLWDHGYSALDIITTLFRVTKTSETLTEYLKLEFIRVSDQGGLRSGKRVRTKTAD